MIKIISRVVRELATTPIAKFGLFLAGIGILIVAITSLGLVSDGFLALWAMRAMKVIGALLFGVVVKAAVAIGDFFKNNFLEFGPETGADE